MSEYTTINDSDLEAGDPFTATQAQAFNNNVLAIIEQDPTAVTAGKFVPGAWYVEDGAGGSDPLYDFATDGGSATITTPDFEAGYDYRLVGWDFAPAGGAISLTIEIYDDVAAAWSTLVSSGTVASTDYASFDMLAIHPMASRRNHHFLGFLGEDSGSGTNVVSSQLDSLRHISTSARTLGKMRIQSDAGGTNFASGTVYLFKRKWGNGGF